MKRYWLILTFGVLALSMLTGCLGALEQRAESAQQGLAEAKFETYSKAAAIGATIEINNELATPVTVKITITEDEDAWKSFEIPGNSTLQVEVGAREYRLEAQTEHQTSNELLLVAGDTTISITDNWFGD